MGVKYVKEFEFPADHGFTASAGATPVRGHLRGGPVAKAARNAKIATVMGEFKAGKLRSGSAQGPKVKGRKQAVAIAMSEAGADYAARARRPGGMKKGGPVGALSADMKHPRKPMMPMRKGAVPVHRREPLIGR